MQNIDENNLILVIDVGTQSLKVSIVADKGETIAIHKNVYKDPYFSPKNGYVEQYPDFYYNKIAESCQIIKKSNEKELNKCKGVVLCAFRDTAALLDKDFNVVRPSILWLDQRSAKLEKNIPFHYELIFSIVGMMPTVIYNRKRTPAIWLQENEKENWEKIKYYVPLTAYWNYRLTGKLVDSAANTVGHYPINFKKGTWYKDGSMRNTVFQIPNSKLCPLVKVGDIIGHITKKSSFETGIPEGLPLIASGSDKACECFGNGCLKSDQIALSFGTACTVDVPSKRYHEPEAFLPGYLGAYKDIYNLEVQIYRGFWMLKWFISEFAEKEQAEAKIKDISVEEILDTKILNIEPGSNGLVLQPYWGPGLKRPNARGVVIGFSDYHTKYHLYRAIIEGICFALKEGLETIQKRIHYHKVDYLVVSGGGSKNDIICQIVANIFNEKVKRIQTTESSTLGAAMAGFYSLGIFKTPEEAKEKMVKYQKEFLPEKEAVDKYNYLYKKVYKKIYPKLNKTYADLKEFSNNEIQ